MSILRPIIKNALSQKPRNFAPIFCQPNAILCHARRGFTSRPRLCKIKYSLGQSPKPSSNLTIIYALSAVFISLGVWKSATNSNGKKIFDPPRFTPFEIVSREEVSPTSIILTLRPRNLPASKDGPQLDPYREQWEDGIWSVEIKQPELQIARRYTPLPPLHGTSKTDLRFLIRKEHKGEMSGYLHNLPVGAEVGLRGPHLEYHVPEGLQRVVFLAGGTSIAPALQVAHTLLERPTIDGQKPDIHIIWANRWREDCNGGGKAIVSIQDRKGRVVRDIEGFQQTYPGRFTVEYFVDEEGKFLDQKTLSKLVQTNAPHASPTAPLLLISGPEGFVSYLAGPKKWEAGKEEQGILGGVFGHMRLRNWTVWKL